MSVFYNKVQSGQSSGLFKSVLSGTNNLEKGLDAAWLRNEVISNNIANIDTPNFKSSQVEFESLFRDALDRNTFQAKKSRARHIDFDYGTDVSPRVVQNTNTTMRMDGNNVDIEFEEAELAKNAIYLNTLVSKINSEFSQLRTAIGRR